MKIEKQNPKVRFESASGARSESKPAGGQNKIVLLFLLASFFLFFGCLGFGTGGTPAAQDYIGPIFASFWAPWQPLFFIALSLGVGIIAFAWLYASFVMDDKLKVWCKRELVQLGFSVLILITILALVGSMSNWMVWIATRTPMLSGSSGQWSNFVALRCGMRTGNLATERPCHIRIAEDYLQILAVSQQNEMASVARYYQFLSVLSTLDFEFKQQPDPAGILHFHVFGGLSMVLETLSFAFDLAVKNLMVIRAQQDILEFMHLAFFPLFLSMGLFFRTLYFTRRLGGLLIALAFGFYIVFPLTYVLFHSMLYSVAGPWPGSSAAELTPDKIGNQLYTMYVNLSGVDTAPIAGFGNCSLANGSRRPGAECAANADCPPISGGVIAPGYERKFYCDAYRPTASCTCTSDAYASFRDPNSGYVSFNLSNDTQIMNSGVQTNQTLVTRTANLAAAVCGNASAITDPAAQLVELNNTFTKNILPWSSKAYDGYIHAAGVGFGTLFGGDSLIGFGGVIDNLAKILIFSLISPFVAIMASLAGVKALSPLLGGDVEIAGLTRLI